MTGVYLSLNQGWTQYKDTYGTSEGKKKIKLNAEKARGLLKSYEGFVLSPIKLDTTKDLGKGYELGNICSKYYPGSSLPSDSEIVNDLRNLIGVYRELKGLVGPSILDIQGKVSEEEFQQAIQGGKKKVLPKGPVKKNKKINASSSPAWIRDPEISAAALEYAEHQCENDLTHKTFISEKSNKQFVEAHHLLHMEYQDEFEFSIDVTENIVSLCPNCHRAFHNAESKTRQQLIKKFLNIRITGLNERGITASTEELSELLS